MFDHSWTQSDQMLQRANSPSSCGQARSCQSLNQSKDYLWGQFKPDFGEYKFCLRRPLIRYIEKRSCVQWQLITIPACRPQHDGSFTGAISKDGSLKQSTSINPWLHCPLSFKLVGNLRIRRLLTKHHHQQRYIITFIIVIAQEISIKRSPHHDGPLPRPPSLALIVFAQVRQCLSAAPAAPPTERTSDTASRQ